MWSGFNKNIFKRNTCRLAVDQKKLVLFTKKKKTKTDAPFHTTYAQIFSSVVTLKISLTPTHVHEISCTKRHTRADVIGTNSNMPLPFHRRGIIGRVPPKDLLLFSNCISSYHYFICICWERKLAPPPDGQWRNF